MRAILETVGVHRAAGAGPFDLVVVNHERPDADRLAELERRGRHLVAAGLRRAPAALRRAGRRGGRPATMTAMSEGEAITAEGLEALKAELARWRATRGATWPGASMVARELGDLSENAEYHIAKEDQAHLETKILRLTERLRNARRRRGADQHRTWSRSARR